MVRRAEIADASLAARREARRLGIAMAAMMPIIATTISSSMSEKPFWPLFFCIWVTVLLRENCLSEESFSRRRPSFSGYAPVARDFGRRFLKQGPCHGARPALLKGLGGFRSELCKLGRGHAPAER